MAASWILDCKGWWEQDWYGRQPMERLRVSFQPGSIRGAGNDVIGPFELSGTICHAGAVAIRKQYLGMHSVDYLGVYDGEGVMSGKWRAALACGTWMIRIGRLDADNDMEITEFVPKG